VVCWLVDGDRCGGGRDLNLLSYGDDLIAFNPSFVINRVVGEGPLLIGALHDQ
jgi:hypothetical protein